MDKESTEKLIKNTFQNSFNKEKYVYFIKNLLKRYDELKAFHLQGCYIPKAFENFIKTFERIGTYIDPDGKKIDLLIVYLKKETTLDRARTAQRNFVAHYLKERGEKDAGLVAFVSPEEEDWRFSFLKMEYKFEKTPTGDVKVKQEFTPARRHSFLVGKNENSHTAQSCFMSILKDDTYNPKLYELEEAFSIEKVTKEFFEKYRNLFLEIKDSLDEIVKRDEEIRQEFQEKGINTVDFSKKLLGQIVFLYFLQKKGWFGIEKGKKWGSGSKHFLRELFEKKHCDYENFFNNILEPLFYEALRNDRSYDDHYFSYFKCKIPFLNGGLFDPINNYNWAKTDILLPNTLFSNNNKTKEGDIGTGVLDVFDRYNFTVKEDEPLDKEVAIDPEMLGKVFENLLEVKDRKSKGTYYTPREIVHYMCQESLIYYLYTEINNENNQKCRIKKEKLQIKLLGKPDPVQQSLIIERNSNIIPKEDIEKLIKYGDSMVEHNYTTVNEFSKNPNYKGSYKNYKLPQSIVNNAELIDDKLKSIKVCDPAVGSGAFLVGMMNEIIRARNALTPILLSQKDSINQSMDQSHTSTVMLNNSKESRIIYDFKHHAIQNCLYGVDIDPGAVEIAKLRLWLSLIVDEEDIKRIRPLPNLDYKIVCGNSLLGVERNLENWKLFAKLEELKPLFFNETNASKKQEYKMQIDELISEITNGHKDFDFEVYFSEVFHEKSGFDVVISNPPYVEHKKLKKFSPIFKSKFKTYSGTTDLYVYFYEITINILKPEGILTFISSNKFIRTSYGAKLRELLANNRIHQIIDFTKVHIFDALVASCVIIVSKGEKNKNVLFSDIDNTFIEYNSLSDFIRKHHIKVETLNLNKNIWQLENETKLALKEKIEQGASRIKEIKTINIYRGVTTGYNPAFIIDNEKRKKLISEDKSNAVIIKPLLQGRNIRKWIFNKSNEYLIFVPWHFPLHLDDEITGASKKAEKALQEKYASLFYHLKKFKRELSERNKDETGIRYEWYALQRYAASYYSEFEKEKIIWGLTADKWAFAYDDKRHYLPSNGYILTSTKVPIKYILALLNSKLMKFYFGFIGIMTAGGAFTLKHQTISEFPIKEIPIIKQKILISLVDKILVITKDDDYLVNFEKQDQVRNYEFQIDEMVYKLYNLTPEEIKLVEGFKKNKKI